MSQRDFGTVTPALVSRAVDGHAGSMKTLLAALQPALHSLALRMLGNRDDAADALQECLLRIVTRLSTYRAEAKFTTWAWTLAVRSFLDYRRGMARYARLSFETFREDLADGMEETAVVRADDHVYLQQVKVGCSRALLQCLDGDHRVAYVLVEIMGFEPSAAAEVCEVQGPTFRKRLSRARTRVRGHLEASCGVAQSKAACRCHRRLAPARKLGRLHPDDGMDVSVDALTKVLDGAASLAAYYRHDRAATVPPEVLQQVIATLSP